MSRESTLALCKELRSPVVILDILSWAKIVMHLQVRILTGSATQQEACQLQETSKLAAHVVQARVNKALFILFLRKGKGNCGEKGKK